MKPFPEYAYIPGVNARPKDEEPLVQKIDPQSTEPNEWFQYAIALFRAEFYWESHIYFEALWKAHDREGPIADVLKALIKIAAAGVNLKQGQWDRGKDQLKRAAELLLGVQASQGDELIGLNLPNLIQKIKEMPAFPQQVAGTLCHIL